MTAHGTDSVCCELCPVCFGRTWGWQIDIAMFGPGTCSVCDEPEDRAVMTHVCLPPDELARLRRTAATYVPPDPDDARIWTIGDDGRVRYRIREHDIGARIAEHFGQSRDAWAALITENPGFDWETMLLDAELFIPTRWLTKAERDAWYEKHPPPERPPHDLHAWYTFYGGQFRDTYGPAMERLSTELLDDLRRATEKKA